MSDALASSTSLQGQLQRGRGAGFLAALRADPSVVRPLLVECITHDPRWDTQVENRGFFYAELAVEVGLETAPLERHLRENDDREEADDRAGLTLSTLGKLAALGRREAVRILREYVDYGYRWDWAVENLDELDDPEATVGLADAVCRRAPDDEALRQVGVLFDYTAPRGWWACNPRLSRLAEWHADGLRNQRARRAREECKAEELAGLSVEELLRIAGRDNFVAVGRALALRATPADLDRLTAGVQSDDLFVAAAVFPGLVALGAPAIATLKLALQTRELPVFLWVQASRALRALAPEPARQLAREGFDSPVWRVRQAAEILFAAHATEEDLPRLREAVPAALHSGHTYRLCHLLEALTRFPGRGWMPEVEAAFVETGYSHARRRAAEAMAATAPHEFARSYALECLWDCEEETREVGCGWVDLHFPEARRRLQELAQDPHEEQSVRDKARSRIADIS